MVMSTKIFKILIIKAGAINYRKIYFCLKIECFLKNRKKEKIEAISFCDFSVFEFSFFPVFGMPMFKKSTFKYLKRWVLKIFGIQKKTFI